MSAKELHVPPRVSPAHVPAVQREQRKIEGSSGKRRVYNSLRNLLHGQRCKEVVRACARQGEEVSWSWTDTICTAKTFLGLRGLSV